MKCHIENYFIYKWLCEYDSEKGQLHELLRSKVSQPNIVKGFYARIDDHLIGVFSTKKGPILFLDQRQFEMKQGECQLFFERKGEQNLFRLNFQGETVFKLLYDVPPVIPTNPYEDEESADFLLWLYNLSRKRGFYERYTVK